MATNNKTPQVVAVEIQGPPGILSQIILAEKAQSDTCWPLMFKTTRVCCSASLCHRLWRHCSLFLHDCLTKSCRNKLWCFSTSDVQQHWSEKSKTQFVRVHNKRLSLSAALLQRSNSFRMDYANECRRSKKTKQKKNIWMLLKMWYF